MTAVAKRKAAPDASVSLADVASRITELTVLEVEQHQEYGKVLLHGSDAEPYRKRLQATREKLSILFSARAELERETAANYDAAITALTKQYREAALNFDASLAGFVAALEQVSRVGQKLKSAAYARKDPNASQYNALVFDPGAVPNILSETLSRLFREPEPWKSPRVDMWVQAQGVGLIDPEDN